MREPGLSEAIRAAGGVGELARQIGISQPSVSNWIRIPAERVISVETVTGVDRNDPFRGNTNPVGDGRLRNTDLARKFADAAGGAYSFGQSGFPHPKIFLLVLRIVTI